jgi:peptide/nickel transport system permease protein
MTKFIIRRAIQAIPTLIGITVIAFAIMSLAPGGPTTALGFNPELTARQRAAMAEALGVDDPWHVQYFRWVFGDGAYILGGQQAWRVDVNTNSPEGTYYILDAETGDLLETGSNVSIQDVIFEGERAGVAPAEAPAGINVTANQLEAVVPQVQRNAELKEAFYIPGLTVRAWRIDMPDEQYYLFDAQTGSLLGQGAVDDISPALQGIPPADAPNGLRNDADDLAGLLADAGLIAEDVAETYENALGAAQTDASIAAPPPPYAAAAFLPEYMAPAWRMMTDVDSYFIVSANNPEAVLERGASVRVVQQKLRSDKMGYAPSVLEQASSGVATSPDQLSGIIAEQTEGPAPRLDNITFLPNYNGFILWGGRMSPVFDNAANPIGERMGQHFGILRGDFGKSAVSQRPAMEVVLERLPATVELGLLSLFIGLTVGLVVGVLAAVFHDSWFDQLTRVLAVVVSSIPVYWLGLILLLIFGSALGWLPMGGRFPNTISGEYTTWQRVSRLILPVFTLSSFSIATFSRYMRASLLDVLEQDYIRTAYAKGVPRQVVWFKHGMRNALIPIATLIGPSLTLVISGAVLTETIYSWPGMGRLLINSVRQADYNIIMAVVLLLAFATILGYMLSDILYAVFDPRIRLS